MMTKKTSRPVMGYLAISDRTVVVKLQAKPFNIVVIPMYAPTSDHTDGK